MRYKNRGWLETEEQVAVAASDLYHFYKNDGGEVLQFLAVCAL